MNNTKKNATPLPVLIFATLMIGIISGLGGMLLVLLLHFIQHLVYGYSPGFIISNESFLEGVTAASPARRVFVLFCCGLLAGGGWWALYHYGKPLVSIKSALTTLKPRMPIVSTTIHVLLQIVTVALGSPLGREVAPREISALFACWFSAKLGLSSQDARTLVACAAGAGLAAVYNVPLAGALFSLEVLLCTYKWSALLPAVTTSTIAVVISWIGLNNEPLYHIPTLMISYSLVIWSIVTSPIFGACAFWFAQSVAKARRNRQHNWQLPVLCIINFTLIGIFSIYFPAILGNGKSPVQLAFDYPVSTSLFTVLLILRVLITWSSLRAGAEGGVLTPSLAIGALLAVILGRAWNIVSPNPELGAYAIIGASAFLAASNRMPLTAIIIIFELTHLPMNFLIPILFAVAGSVGTFSVLQKTLTPSIPAKTT